MKVLILSQEVWRNDKNGGNVLSNILSTLDAEFAQIYCSGGTPSNNLCKRYYQMTDKMVINNLLHKKKIGKVINYQEVPNSIIEIDQAEQEDKKFYSFFRRHRWQSFVTTKEIIWNISDWKTKELEKFILDFNPDIIFAPCYSNHFMLKLTRYVADLINKPVISYISDDVYSLKQFRLSPIYWGNRLILRKNVKKTFKYYDLVYTMTDEQLEECKKDFECQMKILRKSEDFTENVVEKNIKYPIKLIYAGGIYCGRQVTLMRLANEIKKINKNEIKLVLDIYTGSIINKKQKKVLDDKINSTVNGLVNQEELKEIYSNGNIALHIEGFDLKNRLATRLSFSTKIIDLLHSKCAVMAIAWNKHAGFTYLKKEDAAICIDNPDKIKENLEMILENKEILNKYSVKAWECGKRNHLDKVVKKQVCEDFFEILQKNLTR